MEHGRNGYAAQTWSNVPDGRTIQISWMAGGLFPEMPFNHQMSVPVELSLAGCGADARLRRWPVKELEALRGRAVTVPRADIERGVPFIPDTDSKLFDVTFNVTRNDAKALYVMIRGQPLTIDWTAQAMRFAGGFAPKMVTGRDAVPLPVCEVLSVRVLVDRTSVEVFLNGGEVAASFCYLPDAHDHPFVIQGRGGSQSVSEFELWELDSIWG